ncbi:hypothetical protein IKF12_03280 [Candidatus Saccharibacteria bacterium]|nr:hypothetical protein [Candidatus Saccharibacteria bacterium]
MNLLKRFLIGLTAVVMCVTTSASTYAAGRQLSEEDLFFYGMNGIYFYMPENGDTCFGTLMGSTVYEKVLSGLLSMGLNEIAAAGVYSNLMAEGLGSGGLLTHEYGTDSRDDIGTVYRDVYGNPVLNPVTETDVRDLYNPKVMHGIGPPGWSFNLRVWLLEVLEEYGVEKYATEWNESTGRYTYTGMTYDEMVEAVGEAEADTVLTAVLNYFDRLYIKNEYVDRGYSAAVQQSDIDAQGLAKYGITAGMTLDEALNLVETPYEASQLFFTTGEMPGWTQFDEAQKVHAAKADEGLELIRSAGLTAGGSTMKCGGNNNIVETALELSWEGYGLHSPEDPKPEYVQAMHAVDAWILPCGRDGICPYYGASCDQFVGTVMRYSGVDPDFPLFFGGGTLPNYLKENTDKYEQVEHNEDYANLQPGDIFITYENGDNHIFLFLGEIDGELMQASASWGGRTGEHYAGGINFTEVGQDGHIRKYEVYRKK